MLGIFLNPTSGCRIAAEFKDLEAATKEDREKAVEVAAENRVLIATLRSMQDECHVCKVCTQPASDWNQMRSPSASQLDMLRSSACVLV